MANIEEAVGSSEDAGTLQQADCPAIAPVPPQFADDPDPTPCDKPDKRFVTFREVANNLMLGLEVAKSQMVTTICMLIFLYSNYNREIGMKTTYYG